MRSSARRTDLGPTELTRVMLLAQLLSGAAPNAGFAVAGDYQSAAQAGMKRIATADPRWRTGLVGGPALAKAMPKRAE